VKPYEHANLAELAGETQWGRWAPIRAHFGIGSFGVNGAVVGAGDELIQEHDELQANAAGHEELYVILDGHATFVVDGVEVDAPAGTFVFVPEPASKRSARATAPSTSVIAIGGKRGEAFVPAAWEYNARASFPYNVGDYETAAAIVREGLVAHPNDVRLHYNLACFASLAGDLDTALAALDRALSLDPEFAVHARSDEDLEALRGRPDFEELVGSA
jgi:tetratricopeptide (TPR) repeat protein